MTAIFIFLGLAVMGYILLMISLEVFVLASVVLLFTLLILLLLEIKEIRKKLDVSSKPSLTKEEMDRLAVLAAQEAKDSPNDHEMFAEILRKRK
ncbi:hypothetical protein M3231_10375 [Neobacillus mesonae]|nr:hypothetical protein [Neobacillus mesonae]